jgi:dipeptidyl-peptidase 4
MRVPLGPWSLAALTACAPPPDTRAPVSSTTPESSTHIALAAPPTADAAPNLDLLRALAQTRTFYLGTPTHPTISADGKAVVFLRSAARDPKQSLYEMGIDTGSVRELVSPDALLSGPETLSPEERVQRERRRVRTTGLTSFELSDDGTKVLVTLSGRAFVVDRASGKARPLPTGSGAVLDPRWSPDGTRVAYVRDDDIYTIHLASGREVRVTRGGSERITHGLAEFIAEEEFDRARGLWWSPDGGRILYEEADTRGVDILSIADPMHPEQLPQHIAYPRAGHANASLRFGIVAASGEPTTWVQWDRTRFPYVAQASWPEGGPPLLYVLDRPQQVGQLLAIDAASGRTRTLVEERDAAWLNVDSSVPRWLRDGTGFLWSREGTDDWRLELRDPNGAFVRELLPPGFGYMSVADVDEKTRTAVVIASDDPTREEAWAVSLDGRFAPKHLSQGHGVVWPTFGKRHDRYVSQEASLTAMPRWMVRSLDGSTAREIPSVAESPPSLPAVEIAQIGEEHVRVALVRPSDFRADATARRRYAVLDAAYAGPGFTVVKQSALAFVRAQWMADATQAVVVAIDARGTPRRGRDWERALWKKVGSVPLEGHIAALRALGVKYPELDVSRVGVYGWSFGGYFAALAVLRRPDVYRVACAGAPGVDWRDYDTAYTERYLGLPEENSAAYDDASLLSYARKPVAPSLARPLLLVHGTADDNVWFVNAVKLADALERGQRPFEFFPLGGTTHVLRDPDLYQAVYLREARLLRDALGGPQ